MNRRGFVALIGGVLTAPRAFAQEKERVYRVGAISPSTPLPALLDSANPFRKTILDALRQRGYVEGRNLVYDPRSAEGDLERIPGIVADFVRLRTDVIFVPHIGIAQIAAKASATLPIISLAGDPVVRGLAQSYNRPGGNITGIHAAGTTTVEQKRLEFLRLLAPNARRVAFVATREWWDGILGDALRQAAISLGMHAVYVESTFAGFGQSFVALRKEKPDAVFFEPSPTALAFRSEIGAFALESRVPTACGHQEVVEAGCLMTYNFLTADTFRILADYIDRILKGARPGDLPLYQYDRYEFAINARTAKAIGLAIPSAVLLRADRVIE